MDQEKDYSNALKLVGKIAGKICYGNVPIGHITEIVTNAADLKWSSFRSHWTLIEVW